MSVTIDEFRKSFGYGARLNLFEVHLTFPFGGDAEEFTIHCKAASFPASREIEQIEIPYMGDSIQIAGDKAPLPGDVSFVFFNKEDYLLRNSFELWIETIQQDNTGFRTSPDLYQSPYCQIWQLDHLHQPIRKVELVRSWPKGVSEITFGHEQRGLTETTINMAYDYWKIVAL